MATKPKTATTKSAVDPCDAEISTARVASLLGLTPVRIRQLVGDGYIAKGERNRIVLSNAVQGYIRFLKDEERRTSKTASASRVQDARARELDLKIAERDGSVIDVVEHRDLFAEVFGGLKSDLDGVPARLTRDMAFRRKIGLEIDDVFRKAADRFEQAAADASDAGPAASADQGNDT